MDIMHYQSSGEEQLELPFDLEKHIEAAQVPFAWMIWQPKPSFEGQGIHMVPTHDLYPHDLVDHCWCEPEEDMLEDEPCVFHQAADGREAYEHGDRLLN